MSRTRKRKRYESVTVQLHLESKLQYIAYGQYGVTNIPLRQLWILSQNYIHIHKLVSALAKNTGHVHRKFL